MLQTYLTPLFLRNAACMLVALWLFLDLLVVFTKFDRKAKSADRGSLWIIMLVFWASMAIGVNLAYNGVGEFGASSPYVQLAGFAVMLGGIAVRGVAIAQLGRLHMPVVAIQGEHPLMDKGLYGLVRHPSYFGATLGFLGFGLALGSWPAALVIVAGALLGYGNRIRVEEQALVQGLGERYRDYARRTKRFIPWVY